MINLVTAASIATLLTAAPLEQVPLAEKWLVRCDLTAADALPSLEVAQWEEVLAGRTAAPDGWEIAALPYRGSSRACSFVTRLPASSTERGVWFGQISAAVTVWLDGGVVWRKGREEGPYWRSDQGFGGFLIPARLLEPAAPRLLHVRVFNKSGAVAVPAPTLVDPLYFPELQEQAVGIQLRMVAYVMWIFAALALGGFIFFLFRRDRRILYFSLGTEGFSLLFVALTAEFMAIDHSALARMAMLGTFTAYTFYPLFFQHLYGIHRRPLFDRLAFGVLGVVVLLTLTISEAGVMRVFSLGAPLYLGGMLYAVYLNVRARREGNPIARDVLWGFAAYFLTILVDATKYFLSGGARELKDPLIQFGVLAFVISVLVAVCRRFLKLSVESTAMLNQMQGAAAELGGLVANLQTASSQLTSAAAEQVTALTETATTTTEMNQTSAISATRAAELIQQGEAVASVVEDGKLAAETSRTAIQEVSGALATVSSATSELAERVQRIDRIIDTVSFLADQSAALAINASIEASRAGEAGQGFAAVAREVRSLANDSRRATAEVRDVLDEIRKRTLQVESQVSQGGTIVQGGVTHVSRVAAVVETLGGTLRNAVGLMRQVESSARQHQAGVEQVLQAVTNIQRASESIRDGAESLSALSNKARSLSAGLVQTTSGK